jgi:hypothetical protein
LITKSYLKQGKDGFECLMNCPVIIEDENIPVLYNLVQNHFKTISKLKKNQTLVKFRSSIVPLCIVNRLINRLSHDPDVLPPAESIEKPDKIEPKLNFYNAAFLITRVLQAKQRSLSRRERLIIKQSEKYKQKIKEFEEKSMQLAPQLENRIVIIRDEEV